MPGGLGLFLHSPGDSNTSSDLPKIRVSTIPDFAQDAANSTEFKNNLKAKGVFQKASPKYKNSPSKTLTLKLSIHKSSGKKMLSH